MAVDTIIFDMGNVLIRFSHQLAVTQLAKVTDRSLDEVKDAAFTSQLFHRTHTGELTGKQFLMHLASSLSVDTPIEDMAFAACNIFSPVEGVDQALRELKQQGYRLGLLSNVNDIEMNFIRKRYRFLVGFDFEVLSYQEKTAKPGHEIYFRTLQLADRPAERCFFIDDKLENVEAAHALGIHVQHWDIDNKGPFAAQLRIPSLADPHARRAKGLAASAPDQASFASQP